MVFVYLTASTTDTEVDPWPDGCHHTLACLGCKATNVAEIVEQDCATEKCKDGRSYGVDATWFALVEDGAEQQHEADRPGEHAVALITSLR